MFYHYYLLLSTPCIFGLFLPLIKYVPLLECFQHALFLFSPKAQFKSHYFFEAFSHYQSHLFLPPLISLSTHELFGDWHLLTCVVILM